MVSEAEAAEVSTGSTSVGLLFFPREEWERDWRDPRVRILRQDDSQKWILQGTLAWDEAGQDKVTELFGGGRFMAQLVGADERGAQAIRKSQVYRFPGLYKPPARVTNQPIVAANGPTPQQRVGTLGDGGDGSVTPTQALNVALVDSVIGLMKAMKEPAPRPATMDWGPILAAVMPLLTTIVTKMLDGKRDDSLLHQLQAMQDEIVKMRDRPGPAANAITDALAGIERIVKVSSSIRDMSGTPEGETSIWGALGKEALGLLANAQRNQQPTAGAAPALPPPSPTPGAPTPVTLPLWQQLLMSQRHRLLDAASRGLDPEMVADFAVQFLPEQHVGVMTEFLQRPDAVTVLQQAIPELTNFPTWCENLVTALRATMFSDGEEGEAAAVTG